MKVLGTLSIILMLALFSPVATGYCADGDEAAPVKVHTQKFVDLDGDGICDNQVMGLHRGSGKAFVDADHDGVCDDCGGKGKCLSRGQAKGLTDADGNGIKDKREAARGLKRGQTDTQHSANFIDRNGDGVSDNSGKGFTKDRSGMKTEAPVTSK
jgi:hypothetical protein